MTGGPGDLASPEDATDPIGTVVAPAAGASVARNVGARDSGSKPEQPVRYGVVVKFGDCGLGGEAGILGRSGV